MNCHSTNDAALMTSAAPILGYGLFLLIVFGFSAWLGYACNQAIAEEDDD
jgi:polyferredoxin